MIKELWTLVRMLFGTNPKDVDGMTVIEMKHFPFEGYKAMSWCGCIVHRVGASEVNEKTVNHETIHLMQAKQCGTWVKYYWRYFVEWVKGNPFIAPASSAYYTSKYESEAYANEEDLEYWENYEADGLKKYTFEGRKKLYKEVGGTPRAWKEFVKKL